MRPDYESSVIDRGRGMGWATALGARSSGKNTDNCTLAIHITFIKEAEAQKMRCTPTGGITS